MVDSNAINHGGKIVSALEDRRPFQSAHVGRDASCRCNQKDHGIPVSIVEDLPEEVVEAPDPGGNEFGIRLRLEGGGIGFDHDEKITTDGILQAFDGEGGEGDQRRGVALCLGVVECIGIAENPEEFPGPPGGQVVEVGWGSGNLVAVQFSFFRDVSALS